MDLSNNKALELLKRPYRGMKAHVQQYNSQTRSADYVEDYGFIFREQFCVAAQDLADGTHRSLDKMGFLYDEIIVTGGTSLAKKHTDLEASHGRKVSFPRE